MLAVCHVIAYFALRVQEEPIDALLAGLDQEENKHLRRGSKRDIRGSFSFLFVGISAIGFLLVTGAHLANLFEDVNGNDALQTFMVILNPEWQRTRTVLTTGVIFALSLLYVRTLRMERSSYQKQSDDWSETELAHDPEKIQFAIQLLKDFKFKRHLTVMLEMVVLAMIASTGSNIFLVLVPYTLIFTTLALIVGISGSQRSLSRASSFFTIPLMAVLLIDFPLKYILQSTSLRTNGQQISYFKQVLGVEVDATQFLSMSEFILKVLLFVIECQKLQYPLTSVAECKSIYCNLKDAFKHDNGRLFVSRPSFAYWIFKPVSVFFFSTNALLFALSHPSMLLLLFVPLFIYGFFIKGQLKDSIGSEYKCLSKFFLLVITLQVMSTQVFFVGTRLFVQIVGTQITQDQLITINVIEKILGLGGMRNGLGYDAIGGDLQNRWTYDFLYLLGLSFFGNFINRKPRIKIPDDVNNLDTIQIEGRRTLDPTAPNLSYQFISEEDVLTINDDSLSESNISQSKLKLRTSQLQNRLSAIQEQKHTPILTVETNEANENGNEVNQRQKKTKSPLSKDETLRGKIRRAFYKVYRRLSVYFDDILNLASIHCSKLSLFALFVVSASFGPTIFNAILFILFLILTTISYQNVQLFWRLTIITDSAIILAMYTVEVFSIDSTQISQSTLQLIGLSNDLSSKQPTFIGKYTPYLALLLVLVFTYHIIHSERYEKFLSTYQTLEDTDKKEEANAVHDKSDPITQQIIRYSIYLTVVALFIECVLLPINALNLTLLVLMTIIIIRYLRSSSLIELYKSLEYTIIVLKWVSTAFIFLKYMFQFGKYIDEYANNYYVSHTSDTNAQKKLEYYFDQIPFIAGLLGIENSFIPAKLFSLALVMSLTNLQAKFLKYSYLTEMLRQEDKSISERQILTSDNQTSFRVFWNYLKTYTIFSSLYLLQPLSAFLLICYAVREPSILTLFLFLTALSVICKYQQNERGLLWSETYKSIGIITTFTLLGVYTVQFLIHCIFPPQAPYVKYITWSIGIFEETDKYIDKPLLPLFGIIAVCAFYKNILLHKQQLTPTITKEMVDQNQDLQKQWDQEKPLRQCQWVLESIIVPGLFKFSLILLQFILMISIMYKNNVSSIVYAVYFVVINWSSLYPLSQRYSQEFNSKKAKLVTILGLQILVISCFMIFEFVMMITDDGIEILTKISQWKVLISSIFCSQESCQNEWQQWLSIGYLSKGYIFIDFFFLIMTIIARESLVCLSEDEEEFQYQLHDSHDFLSQKNQFNHSVKEVILTWLFCGLPYITIFYTVIYATSANVTEIADLMSAIYLFIALYYVINFRKLFTQNTVLFQRLRLLNLIALFSMISFQIPFFACPAADPNDNGQNIYITNEKCIQLQMQFPSLQSDIESIDHLDKATNGNGFFAFYIVLMKSIGFYKYNRKSNDIQISFILMIILTELQNYIFHHPYFQVYVIQHMEYERQTDGRLRAFMFVERTHLNTLWAYKAIKEEIRILHQRLLRITQAIKLSEHSRHLLMDDDEEDQAQNRQERDTLMSEQSSASDYNAISSDVSYEDVLDPIARLQLDVQFNKIMSHHANDIENIALDLLTRPGTPVVPLKLFMAAFKNYLQNKYYQQVISLQKSNEEQEEQKESDQFVIDQIAIEEYLLNIAQKLQKQVHLKSRLDLFNKEGYGLHFAINKGSDQLIKDGDYQFYHHLILSETKNEERGSSVTENEEEENTFDIKDSYQEMYIIREKLSDAEKRKVSRLTKLSYYVRTYLWTKFVNKLLFYSLMPQHSDLSDAKRQHLSLYSISIVKLIGYCILSQSQNICYFTLFLNFIINTDLLSLVLPLSALIYSMLESPTPSSKYWKSLMVYDLAIIFAKFIYQLPIFCGTPVFSPFSISTCSSQHIPPEVLINRIDYIIGIHKFSGPSSYPKDSGILLGIWADLLVLFALLLLKTYLIRVGHWHYVRVKKSIYDTPSFKCDLNDLTEDEREKIESKAEDRRQEYENSDRIEKCYANASMGLRKVKNFMLRLLPVYMTPIQKNRDLRRQEDEPELTHNVKRVKPGKDYFSASFFSLLLILAYNLFFYRNFTGDVHSSAISSANLQRFSIPQVSVLFFLLLLMMIERMLYRVRQIDSQSVFAKSGILGKHQLTFKLAIHIFLVIYVHIELGMVVPKQNNVSLSRKFPLLLMYLLWVYYFVCSALQIRHGYPQAPFKAPFIRDTSLLTVWAFRIYKAIPFLWEMKVIIDWTVTSTCLDLFQWFKLDDAFNYLYSCQYQNNDRAQRQEFVQRPWYEKFFQGFCFAFALILVILAPILLFSGINPIMVKNPVLSGQMQISIELNQNGNAYSILQTQAYHLQSFNQSDMDSLQTMFAEGSTKFELANMQKMYFSPYSEVGWSISPPSQQKFIDDYNDIKNDANAFFDVKAVWTLQRANPVGNEKAIQETRARLSIQNLQPVVDTLSHSRHNTSLESAIVIENIFPKILKLGDTQQSRLMDAIPLMQNMSILGSARLILNDGSQQRNSSMVNQPQQLYWTYDILKNDRVGVFDGREESNQIDAPNMVLVVYNEQVIGSFFGTALQLSVVGLYATIVIAIGRFLRLAFDRISQRVIYEEMDPETTEQLFEICEGIYIAQLEGDLVKEKRLYDLLIRMYRSPETLIKINRKAKLEYQKDEPVMFSSSQLLQTPMSTQQPPQLSQQQQ